tara:strand:+ start:1230 stop:1358 length:129 start_codon:yes stop_codon:yes gene_type:complete
MEGFFLGFRLHFAFFVTLQGGAFDQTKISYCHFSGFYGVDIL